MRVLLLATTTGYQTRSFEDAAANLGVELVYATDRCHVLDDPWQDRAIPIRFHEEDASVDAIVKAARTRPLDGLLTVGDRPTAIAARVARALGLPGHPPAAAATASDKQRVRECLREAGLPVPWFLPIAIDTDARTIANQVTFPCVVKPLALSGSRGVMRADDPESLLAALDRLRRLLHAFDLRSERNDAHERALIEGFIPGREYAVEGLLDRGRLQVLAIFDKPDPLDGPFFEETIYLTPSRLDAGEQTAIVAAIERAIAAMGLWHGPIHAECRVNGQGVFVLEVAARPIGGLCARALRFERTTNPEPRIPNPEPRIPNPESRIPNPESLIPLETLLLRHAVGESVHDWKREPDASGVMMIPIPRRGVFRYVHGVDEARRTPHVYDVRITAKIDQRLVPLPEGASYLGFIFARAQQVDAVEHALRAAHRCLQFTIDPEVPVYNRSHG